MKTSTLSVPKDLTDEWVSFRVPTEAWDVNQSQPAFSVPSPAFQQSRFSEKYWMIIFIDVRAIDPIHLLSPTSLTGLYNSMSKLKSLSSTRQSAWHLFRLFPVSDIYWIGIMPKLNEFYILCAKGCEICVNFAVKIVMNVLMNFSYLMLIINENNASLSNNYYSNITVQIRFHFNYSFSSISSV